MKASWCEMNVDKAEIVAILRIRGLDTRADWADRTLPDVVDTVANAGLLRTLAIDLESLWPSSAPSPERSGPPTATDCPSVRQALLLLANAGAIPGLGTRY
jgi:hypothetical protein